MIPPLPPGMDVLLWLFVMLLIGLGLMILVKDIIPEITRPSSEREDTMRELLQEIRMLREEIKELRRELRE